MSWAILGTPALICFGMWVYKHDRDVFAPMREERRLQAEAAKAKPTGNDSATRRLPQLPICARVAELGEVVPSS